MRLYICIYHACSVLPNPPPFTHRPPHPPTCSLSRHHALHTHIHVQKDEYGEEVHEDNYIMHGDYSVIAASNAHAGATVIFNKSTGTVCV